VKVAVVGAGFWGVAIALALRERDAEVHVYDDGADDAASRAAAGLVQESWYRAKGLTSLRLPDWWDDAYSGAGWGLLRERCGLHQVGEWFGTPNNPEWRLRSDLYMVQSPRSLLDLAGIVRHWRVMDVKTTNRVAYVRAETTTGTWHSEVYDHCVIAAGYRTDRLHPGVRTGVVKLPGRAFITSVGPEEGIPRTWLGAPYRHLTWRPWGLGQGRLGDTVERSPQGQTVARWRRYAEETLLRMDPTAHVVDEVYGVRPVLPKIVAEEVVPRVWAATGGHRVGLALAGGVARRITEGVFGDDRPT